MRGHIQGGSAPWVLYSVAINLGSPPGLWAATAATGCLTVSDTTLLAYNSVICWRYEISFDPPNRLWTGIFLTYETSWSLHLFMSLGWKQFMTRFCKTDLSLARSLDRERKDEQWSQTKPTHFLSSISPLSLSSISPLSLSLLHFSSLSLSLSPPFLLRFRETTVSFAESCHKLFPS